MKYYVIRNKDNHDEFWSNEFGWVSSPYEFPESSNADIFSEGEKEYKYNLPIGGEWVLWANDKPNFRWFNLVGNPINGFRLLGPFASHEDAVEWQEGCDESCLTIEAESEGLY